MSNISYSIIIPHKNIPQLLRRCLDSIPRRDDIQIIVVDDNSSPDKVDFDKFPGVGEPCVEVYFTKEGKGAGYARNVGVSKAKGRWLLFADADDFYNPCFLESIDKYKDSDVDVAYFNATSVDSDTLEDRSRNGRFVQYHEQKNSCVKEFSFRFIIASPFGKMVKRKLFVENNIKFSETIAANDRIASLYTGIFAQNVIVDSSAIYCVTEREGSLTYQKSPHNIYAKIEVYFEVQRIAKRYRFPIQIYQEDNLVILLCMSLKMSVSTFCRSLKICRKNGTSIKKMAVLCMKTLLK